MRYAHPNIQKYLGNFKSSIFLTEYSIMGSIFTRRLSFFRGKSIREYFMSNSGVLVVFLAYVGESRIIKTLIN